MSLDEFYESITGKFVVDLRKYCFPPLSLAETAAQKNYGKIGNEQEDGTGVYAGISPNTGKPMFAEKTNEGNGLKYSFGAAQRRANRLTRQTGHQYRVPTDAELQVLAYNRIKGWRLYNWYDLCRLQLLVVFK